MALVLAHRLPMRQAGKSLLWAVAGFGIATIVFGLSRNPYLSFAMLLLTGALDNISVVVRQTLVQLLTPDEMRGRVSAINAIFIASSNELGRSSRAWPRGCSNGRLGGRRRHWHSARCALRGRDLAQCFQPGFAARCGHWQKVRNDNKLTAWEGGLLPSRIPARLGGAPFGRCLLALPRTSARSDLRAVGVTLVGGTGDQLRENSRFQKASHWPFSLR